MTSRRDTPSGAMVVAAFAQSAVRERRVENLTRLALEHLTLALSTEAAEMVRLNSQGTVKAAHRLDDHGLSRNVDPADLESTPVHRPALDAGGEPVARALNGRRVAATAVHTDHDICIVAGLWERGVEPVTLWPLLAIATLHESIRARRVAERELAEREHAMRQLLDQMPALVWTCDRTLRLTSIEGAALREIGGRGAFLGKSLQEIAGPNSQSARAAQDALQGHGTRWPSEYQGRFFQCRTEPLRDERGQIVGACNVAFDITEQRRSADELRVAHEKLRQLSARMNRLQEEERGRIARELHDELGQKLTALRMETALLPLTLSDDSRNAAADRIEGMVALIDDTIATVRRVATELHPVALADAGFRAAARSELEDLRRRSGIHYSLEFDPPEFSIGRDQATALYRILQESLTNVVRHAGATAVAVSFAIRDDEILAEIRDNGSGVGETADLTLSLGLTSIRERAQALGGFATIANASDGGTIVTVRLPLERNEG